MDRGKKKKGRKIKILPNKLDECIKRNKKIKYFLKYNKVKVLLKVQEFLKVGRFLKGRR